MLRSFAVVAAATLAVAPRVVHADPLDPDHPQLAFVDKEGVRREMPLMRGAIRADIRGPIAQITVTQTYANESIDPIDAVYVFPVPDDAAVGAMSLTSGDRRVRALIKKKDEARAIYDDARRAGKTAALLDQKRPNIFTQSIANLQPGKPIEVELVYDVLLAPEDGRYELALPTVVGPRYIPGGSRPDAAVADWKEITPPTARGAGAAGHAIALAIELDAGLPVAEVSSPTHKIVVRSAGTLRTVALADGAMNANKDFVLRWTVDVADPTVAALAHKSGDVGHVAIVIEPPRRAPDAAVAPARELVFVVDTSGSMRGRPLDLAKRAMQIALDRLRPVDRFRVLNFSSTVSALDGGESLAATRENIVRALAHVAAMQSSGGTEMLSGVSAALGKTTAGIETYVVFMTDGFIGNDQEVIDAVTRRLEPRTRLFSFGVGSSVNRHLLDKMAEVGRGAADYFLLDEAPDAVLAKFLDRLDTPILSDLMVTWSGVAVTDLTPVQLPSLFAGQPIVLVGRYRNGGRGAVTVTGTRGGKQLTYRQVVDLPASGGRGAVLARLWARRRIAELDRGTQDPNEVATITQLALDHSLMSRFTSFVAVEETIGRKATTTVQVPVANPDGVDMDPDGSEAHFYGRYNNAPAIDAIRGTASGSYDGDDEEDYSLADDGGSIATSLRRGFRGKWHGSLDGALAIHTTTPANQETGRAGTAFTAAVERRLQRRIGIGLEASVLNRVDLADVTTVSAVVARWSLLRLLYLRMGLGTAVRFDGDAGLAWHVRAGIAVPIGRELGPELSLRIGQARIDDDDDAVTFGVGLGVRW